MANASPERNGPQRDGRGRFVQQVETVERDAKAAHLRALGKSYQEIADELGYDSAPTAANAVKRCFARISREPAQDAIDLELARLDHLLKRAMEVVERKHVAVQMGKVVRHKVHVPVLDAQGQEVIDPETGRPMTEKRWVEVEDDAPLLDAIAKALRISESRRKLLGLDAPAKKRVEVITTDQFADAFKELEAQVAAQEDRIARRQAEDRG